MFDLKHQVKTNIHLYLQMFKYSKHLPYIMARGKTPFAFSEGRCVYKELNAVVSEPCKGL